MTKAVIAVVGAGTMGAGIAQVAAMAGHRVFLQDAKMGAASAGRDNIATALSKRVKEGKASADDVADAMERIQVVSQVEGLMPADLVIEAILEDVEAKRALFTSLEKVVPVDCLFASNTSSLSITAIARGLTRPERLLGLHFFNPVPAMKLVEVVSGLRTAPEAMTRACDLMRTWGKTPITATNAPGFIVNRIARPFYAEALQLIEQRLATPAQIDAAIKGAGFRMGPCELMDLIGHDVNYAVTQSVFAASFGDRRFVPSRIQRELVEGGLLGRKTGKGFFDYAGTATRNPAEPSTSRTHDAVVCNLSGDSPEALALKASLIANGIPVRSHSQGTSLTIQFEDAAKCRVTLARTTGQPASRLAADYANDAYGVFDWRPDGSISGPLAVSFAERCASESKDLALDVLTRLGANPIVIGDAPGLIVARTLSMLVNEASDAVQQGVCDEPSADSAMRLGTNYPAGPFEWLSALGAPAVVRLLDELQEDTRSERYRVSPHLRRRLWAGRRAA